MRALALVPLLMFLLPAAAGAVPVVRKTIHRHDGAMKIEASYPQTGVAAIDGVLGPYARQWAKSGVEDSPQQTGSNRPPHASLSFTVKRNDASMFAVEFESYVYGGGAHGMSELRSFSFLLPEGRQVFLPELVDGKRGLERIGKLAAADLKRQMSEEGPPDMDAIASATTPEADNFENFALLPHELLIDIAPGDPGGYADRSVTVHIPLTALADVMRPDPRASAPSFACTKAANATEKAICADAGLARLDRQVAERYAEVQEVARITGQNEDHQRLLQEQRTFLADRAACHAVVVCLSELYAARLMGIR